MLLLEEKNLRQSKSDFLFFLTQVKTLDEHDKVHPIKLFPQKEYIKELAQHMVNERLLLIEKSRQMMVTWLGCAYSLWVAMFNDGRRVFMQSKKEKDADELINRVKFIYNQLPALYRQRHMASESYLNLRFGKQNSIIQGTPQGADVIRQYTASLIWGDEMAFQERAEEAFIAAKPALSGGGQFIGVSTPNFKNYFYHLAKDLI